MLTMDPDGQDYVKADVQIEGSKIVAIGPNVGGDGAVIDCTGKIVMPVSSTLTITNTKPSNGRRSPMASLTLVPGAKLAARRITSRSSSNIWTNGLIPGRTPGTPMGSRQIPLRSG